MRFNRKKPYCAFIDYEKAFDTVWREGLWSKLREYSIEGKTLDIMYKNIKSCVALNGVTSESEYFIILTGVRQGENLTPLLFALFIYDMEHKPFGKWMYLSGFW